MLHLRNIVPALRSIDLYPYRYFITAVPEGSDLLDAAEVWAKEAWELWNEGQPDRQRRTYVNYGEGHDYETLEAIYGYEPWRLDRLRSLKVAYDPQNRFRFYEPIVPNPA